MEQLCKFNLKINVILNGLENYINFTINNKLIFIDSFQFLNSSFNSFVKSLSRNDFKDLSYEFDNKVLALVR